MNKQLKTIIKNAFIMGIATTKEGFNGECPFVHLAPDKVANVGDQAEPDLLELFRNKEVNRLADLYVASLSGLPNAQVQPPPSGGRM